MKKQRTILTKLNILWRAACWCTLVVGLTLACGTATAELIPIILKHDGWVTSVSFSPDGKLLATGSEDETAKVWEMPDGKLIATLKHTGRVWSVAFSPDGRLLATGSNNYDRKIYEAKVWEMPSGKLIATMRHDRYVYSVTFSPDGKLLATGTVAAAKVWEMPDGKLIATMRHDGRVSSVAFSPDGKMLATGSYDNTAKVWEMPSGKLITTLRHDSYVYSVSFSPDGKLLATGSYDNTAKVWAPNTADIPILFQPSNGAEFADALPELKWEKLPNVLSYQVQVAKDKDFSQVAMEVSTGAESLKVSMGQLAAGEHFWRVRTVGWSDFGKWSEARTFKLVPPTSALTSPADGTSLADTLTPKLQWQVSIGAGSYGVQIAKDEQFNKVVVEQSNIKAAEWVVPAGKLAPGKYFWRVNATGVFGTGDWSKPWSFSLVPPFPPTLTFPADGATLADTLTPKLQWQASIGAGSYGAQIAKDEQFKTVVIEQSNIKTMEWLVPSGKLAPGKYFWHVNTTGITGTGDWSKPWSFTVDAVNILIAPVITVTQVDATFDIQIEKARNLYGFQFDLQFNPDVLEAVKVTEGDFLKSIGGNTSFLKPSIDNSKGIIKNVVASRMSPGEVDGAGVLATIHFRFKQARTNPITFTLVKLSNEQFQPIPFAYVDGSITLKTEASAKFIVQPNIVNNQVVAKILIENAVNLRGYSVDLEYPSALELLEVKQGDFLKEGWQQTTPYVNTVRFSASKAKEQSVEGSGEIATLTFRIWEGGEQPFTLKNGTLTAPVVTTIYTPELEGSAITVVASPNWEVNKDYVVDMQDIVILGINFDKKIEGNPRPNPDVTRNVLVDLFDLVAVASHYADEYSAVPQPPAAPISAKSKLTVCPTTPSERAILQSLYDKVSRYPDTDVSVLAVKRLLASLLGNVEPDLPKKTRVAQNYPNPFNPETWIPFELAEAADVIIDIYDAKGQLVRTLALGQRPAGFYLTKERAAYWDGRNDHGERVASGVYFYTLTAGKFTATKKFIMLK